MQLERTQAAEAYAERQRKLELRQLQMKQELEAERLALKKEADRYAKLKVTVEKEYAGIPVMAAEIKQRRRVGRLRSGVLNRVKAD